MKKIRKIAMLPMILLLAIAITAIPISINPVSSEQMGIQPTDDAFVEGDEPDEVHDGNYILIGCNWKDRGFLKFDIGSIPDDVTVDDARLYAYCDFQTGNYHLAPDMVIYCHKVVDAGLGWTEETLTWNNKPDYEPYAPFVSSCTLPAASEGVWLSWDITSTARYAYKWGLKLSVCLKTTEDYASMYAYFTSKENDDTGHHPYVYIEYTPNPTPPPTAAFSAEPSSGVIPLTVTFTDESTGVIDNWLWAFGDGTTSLEQNPTHEYRVYGNYTVSLTVFGPEGSDTTETIITALKPPGGLIDQDELTGDWLALYASLYHCTDEAIAEYDYYALKVTVENLYENAWWDLYPKYPAKARIYVEMPGFVEEKPPEHEPQGGSYGSSPGSISFGWYGVGFSLDLPAHEVDYSSWHEDGNFKVQWDVKHGDIAGLDGTGVIIFKDYVEFWVGVRVPNGYKPSCAVYAQVKWVAIWNVVAYIEYHSESLSWVIVDPPGSPSLAPTLPEALDDIETYTGIGNVSIQTADWEKNPKSTFERGREPLGVWIEWNLLTNMTYKMSMIVLLKDSAGEEMMICGMQMWREEDSPYGPLPQDFHYYCGLFGVIIPEWFAPGEATITVKFAALPFSSNDETIATLARYIEVIPGTTCTITII